MQDYSELNLMDVAGGKAVDQVNFQLGKVIENCLDPNTDPTGIRRVTLTLAVKPAADRQSAEISYKVETKLQGDAPGVDVLHISRSQGKAYLSKMVQMDLDALIEKEREGNEALVDDHGVVVGIVPKKGASNND